MKNLVCIVLISACLAFAGCAEGEITVTDGTEDNVLIVSENEISETVPMDTEVLQTTSEEIKTEPEPTTVVETDIKPDTELVIDEEPEVDTDIVEDDSAAPSSPMRKTMYGEIAELTFVDITELGEIEWAEIQMFEWHETGVSLGIAEVRGAEDVAVLNEVFCSLSLEKMDYMEPSPEVFRMYLYASDGTATRISVTPEPHPWINDCRIIGGELDFETLTDIFNRNK